MAKRRKLGEQGLPEVSQQQLQELLAKEAELEKKTRTLADGTIVGEGGLLKIEKKESVENTTHYIVRFRHASIMALLTPSTARQ